MSEIAHIVNTTAHPIESAAFQEECAKKLESDGALVLPDFLTRDAIQTIRAEGEARQAQAYYTQSTHNVYLAPSDPAYPGDHPRNREIISTKGCITTDQIGTGSALHKLYDDRGFRSFLCAVLGEESLHEYADNLSSVNLHYASEGQELGWHFDNSAFAITLMIQCPRSGGAFEYVKHVRDAECGEMGFDLATRVLDGEIEPDRLSMNDGALVLFRGRNAMHRVTPVEGDRTRMLVVLAYNAKPGVALSESARMTFYGRL